MVFHRKGGNLKLIKNLIEEKINQVIVLVRHGSDLPILTEELDQPLREDADPEIRILSRQIIDFCQKNNETKATIRYSNRLRAIQTASIISEEFEKYQIDTDLIKTDGVREVYQGSFHIENHVCGTEYKPLVDAWSAWQKKLDACELLYRFGDPLIMQNGEAEFPQLLGKFKKFGEHQANFSLRLYRMLDEIFEDLDNGLQIIVGHQASCSRIQRIFDAITLLKNVDEFDPGNFVRFLEKQGRRITIDYACGVIINKPDFSLTKQVLAKEIRYLESII